MNSSTDFSGEILPFPRPSVIALFTKEGRTSNTQVPLKNYSFVTIFASLGKNTAKTHLNSTIIDGLYPSLT